LTAVAAGVLDEARSDAVLGVGVPDRVTVRQEDQGREADQRQAGERLGAVLPQVSQIIGRSP
jgi:hypothetical protein